VSVDDVTMDVAEANVMLRPLLRGQDAPSRDDLAPWTRTLVSDCHELLAMVLPLTNEEREFLERPNALGEIAPELLTDDVRLTDIVRTHPGLMWKAVNVRQHRGLGTTCYDWPACNKRVGLTSEDPSRQIDRPRPAQRHDRRCGQESRNLFT